MKKSLLAKVLVCALSFGGVLYAYVQQQNDLTYLRIELPALCDEVRLLEEENTRLTLEIDHFENPNHLMQLAKRPEFSHLKHPIVDEILVLDEGEINNFETPLEEDNNVKSILGLPSVVIGAR